MTTFPLFHVHMRARAGVTLAVALACCVPAASAATGDAHGVAGLRPLTASVAGPHSGPGWLLHLRLALRFTEAQCAREWTGGPC
jgi:hypothetical protein